MNISENSACENDFTVLFIILFQQDDIKDKKRNGNGKASKTADLQVK